jgi:hypothetical protein
MEMPVNFEGGLAMLFLRKKQLFTKKQGIKRFQLQKESILVSFLIGKGSLFPLSAVGSGGARIGWHNLSFFSIQLLKKLGKTFFVFPPLKTNSDLIVTNWALRW